MSNLKKIFETAEAIVSQHRNEYAGVYYMFGGGGSSGSTTSTQTNTPYSGQVPYLINGTQDSNSANAPKGIFSQASNLYNNPSDYPQYYPNSTVAGFNGTENNALTNLNNAGTYSPLLSQDASTQQNILSGGFLSAGNPYQQQEMQSINSQITPQIESQFTQGNSMNNPAAAYATSQGTAAADSAVAGQNYNAALNQLTQTSALAPQTYQSQLTGFNTALGAGQTEQQQAQSQLTDQVNRFNYGQTLPYNMLDQYASIINGNNSGGSSSITSPYYNNTASNAIGAGLGLGSLLSGSGAAAAGGLSAEDLGAFALAAF